MAFQVERPPDVMEIQVRMDCHGCVQKIRRALQTIHGIYKVHFNYEQQKVTVVGWVDPDKVMKAIKKAGKIARLCSHSISPGGQEMVTVDRADAATASSSPATTVTENPVEEGSVQTVTEGSTAPAEGGGSGDEPPPENPPEGPQPDPPQPEGTSAPEPAPAAENGTSPADDPPADHAQGFLIRNGDGYQVTQEYIQPMDADAYREYVQRYPDLIDRRYPVRYNAEYNNYSHDRNNNSGLFRQADSSRFASMFSDENPNACAIA